MYVYVHCVYMHVCIYINRERERAFQGQSISERDGYLECNRKDTGRQIYHNRDLGLAPPSWDHDFQVGSSVQWQACSTGSVKPVHVSETSCHSGCAGSKMPA